MTSPLSQARYQVRFDWGAGGEERLAAADVVVLVDVLPPVDADTADLQLERGAALVVHADLRSAQAAAQRIVEEQRSRGARMSVNVIARGEPDASGLRFAVEDLLGAGAVIDALTERGIDHTSPEAAAAAEAYRGLRGAVRHLLTASASGQALIDAGRGDEVRAAAAGDSAPGR